MLSNVLVYFFFLILSLFIIHTSFEKMSWKEVWVLALTASIACSARYPDARQSTCGYTSCPPVSSGVLRHNYWVLLLSCYSIIQIRMWSMSTWYLTLTMTLDGSRLWTSTTTAPKTTSKGLVFSTSLTLWSMHWPKIPTSDSFKYKSCNKSHDQLNQILTCL